MQSTEPRPSPQPYVIALVTGGRDFYPTRKSFDDLRPALADVALVIEGEATGFDSWVRDRAREMCIEVQPVPALWQLTRWAGMNPKSEGPRRNARMLRWAVGLGGEFNLPLVLIAGPGGTGTADMRRRCSGLDVREVGK